MRSSHSDMPFALAVLPLITLLGVFLGGALFTELGGTLVVVAILLAAIVAGLIGYARSVNWQAMEAAAVEKFGDVFPVVLILLSIGGLIGSWMRQKAQASRPDHPPQLSRAANSQWSRCHTHSHDHHDSKIRSVLGQRRRRST